MCIYVHIYIYGLSLLILPDVVLLVVVVLLSIIRYSKQQKND